MVSRKPLLTSFLCLVLILGAFALIRLNKRDPERIRHNLALLGRMVSKSAKETPKPFLAKIREAKILLDKSCQIIVDEEAISGTYNPQQVAALVERFQGQILEARLSFYDIKISFPEKHEAIIHCTARLKGATQSNERFDEFRELKIQANKIKGKWRFTRFQTIEALEK